MFAKIFQNLQDVNQIQSTFVSVPRHPLFVNIMVSTVGGTSAQLQEGDILTALELFYGLMLPSGNDSAWALAESFGLILDKITDRNELNNYLNEILDIE